MIQMAKPQIGNEEIQRVEAVLRSGMIASGAVVAEFEAGFAKYCGSKHAIAANNGTTALHLALEAVGIQKGDKVLTTPFTFIASSNSIRFCGAKPVFADIDPATYNLDPKAARAALEKDPSIKAILLVHLYGLPCDMGAFLKLKKEFGVLLIEDCAQAHGAIWDGEKVGSIGDISAFSFYATKNMITGEGGMVLTSSDAYAALARKLVNHGRVGAYEHDILGYNYRMTNIAAAIGVCQLEKLPHLNRRRQEIATRLNRELSRLKWLTTPTVPSGLEHVWHQYTIRVPKNRDALKSHLEKSGVSSAIVYPLANCEQKAYAEISGCKPGHCLNPVSYQASQEVLSLPVHPGLTDADVSEIIKAVSSFSA